MLNFSMMQDKGILILRPDSPLSKEDFENLNVDVNTYLSKQAKLHGVMVHVKDFPGWENFGAFIAHVHFVNEHHKQVERIALVTDIHLSSMVELLAKHFTSAEIRKFHFTDEAEAMEWLQSV